MHGYGWRPWCVNARFVQLRKHTQLAANAIATQCALIANDTHRSPHCRLFGRSVSVLAGNQEQHHRCAQTPRPPKRSTYSTRFKQFQPPNFRPTTITYSNGVAFGMYVYALLGNYKYTIVSRVSNIFHMWVFSISYFGCWWYLALKAYAAHERALTFTHSRRM